MAKKAVLEKIKITEISGVDVPAQAGAEVKLIKRKEKSDSGFATGGLVSGEVSIIGAEGYETKVSLNKLAALSSTDEEHTHLLSLSSDWDPDLPDKTSGETSWTEDHSHPWILTPEGTFVIGAVKTGKGVLHTHSVSLLSKKDTDQSTKGTEQMPNEKEQNAELEALKKELETLKKSNEQTKIDLEKAEAISALSGPMKSIFDGLSDTEKDKILGKKVDERIKLLKKYKDNKEQEDPVVYTTSDGIELRKSADPTLVAMAKRNDEMAKQLKESQQKVEHQELAKRADSEFSHLPGTPEAKIALLKAVKTVGDEKLVAEVENMLRAQNSGMAKAFQTVGAQGGSAEDDTPASKLEKMAKGIMDKDPKLSAEQAYVQALSTKEGSELYQASLQ